MPAVIDRLKRQPWVEHLLRAGARYTTRLGAQFGAAITYFSVLAIVPVLMFAFAIAGFVLTVAKPELLLPIATAIADVFGEADVSTRAKVLDLITNVLSNYTSIGVVGLVSALYSGAGWMGNLKNAFRTQSRPELDLTDTQGNLAVKTGKNLLQLVGLILLIAITFGLASLSTSLTDTVIGLFGLSEVRWIKPVLVFAPIVVSVGAGWLLFMYLFWVLPEEHERPSVVRRGALMGAIGLGVLQYTASFLIGQFAGNKGFAVFGPVIALMLFFNVFAQLILFTAAWVATADHPAVQPDEQRVRFPVTPEGSVVDPPADPAGLDAQDIDLAAPRSGAAVRRHATWLAGAATGTGLGALIVYAVSRATRVRRG